LYPNLQTQKFSGSNTILIDCLEDTSEIVLHANKINIDAIYLNENIKDKYELDEKKEFLIIPATVTKGQHTLRIEFNGDMKNKIVGLYSSSYKSNGIDRLIATSKFEPTYARQAFPCFDEPDLKANFSVKLVRPKDDGYISLSNMDIKEEKEDNKTGLTTTYFEESVKMSTYLACFIVSDFTFKEATINTKGIGEDFKLKVYSAKAQENKVDYALEVGKKNYRTLYWLFQNSISITKIGYGCNS